MDKAPTDKIVAGMADIRLLQNVVARFKRLQIDSTEYACLKAIVLFKPGKKIFSAFHVGENRIYEEWVGSILFPLPLILLFLSSVSMQTS